MFIVFVNIKYAHNNYYNYYKTTIWHCFDTWKQCILLSQLRNQRTSGPVNAHLTPGPGIYFNAFIHVYNPRSGADKTLGTNVDVNRKPLSLCPFVASFKTISTRFFFHVFPHVYSPGQGQTIHWGQNFDDNRKAFSLCPYVASFKMISSKTDFIHIFNDFLHVYSPGARAYNPLGTNFWCQQKALITLPIRCKLKKNESDFIHIFNDFIYVYSPGARADNPLGTNIWCQQKALINLPTCCRFKKNCFEVRFYIHFFFMFHHMYIAPGRGRLSIGDKILMTTERPFLFAHMLQVSKWSLRNLILYTFFMILYMYIAPGQGQKTP